MNQFNWFIRNLNMCLTLCFQNGPYACLTVKFQHIGKSQIVDSDIDSLDSVGYMSNLNVQNVSHVFDQYGDREWNFFCSLVVYAFCPLEWNLFCLEGSKYCYLGYMSNLRTCKTFCTFFDLTNIGIGNGISFAPIRNLTLPWTNSIGSIRNLNISLTLCFQNGPYACHTVKFQHIGKSRIVDSDIDSLDSVVGLIWQNPISRKGN